MPYSSTAAGRLKFGFFGPLSLSLPLLRLLLRLARPLPPPFASFFLFSASSRSSISCSRSFLAYSDSSPFARGASISSSSRSGLSGTASPGNLASLSLLGFFSPIKAGGPPFIGPSAAAPPPFGPILPMSPNRRSANVLCASAPFSLSLTSKSLTLEASSPMEITNSAKVLSSMPQWFWISMVTLEIKLSLRSASIARGNGSRRSGGGQPG
mmetsp:Transcript_49286/g.127099  ORF Transcript_49286/g.127099 Transcript_49286/m.127099 type:complete len:211 (+) Transcript_49286:2961-3593(+)